MLVADEINAIVADTINLIFMPNSIFFSFFNHRNIKQAQKDDGKNCTEIYKHILFN